jgi:prepilin-type N-terminal cleavage/methylation domain-containing protein
MPSRPVPPVPSGPDAGFTLIELLIVVAIIAIITAISSAGLLRSRAAANETSALASVRVIFSSQKAYAIACGRGAYAPSLIVLGTPPVPGTDGFISPDLSGQVNPQRAGYRFGTVAGAGSIGGPPDCNNGPTVTAFYAFATPLSLVAGSRSFAVNINGTIWQLAGSVAPTEPFGPPASPIQ